MTLPPQDQPAGAAIPPAGGDFWQGKTLAELIAEQGVKPVADPAELAADFWPEDETADDLVAWVRALRREGQDREKP